MQVETVISDDIYIPGEKICSASHAKCGYGTIARDGFVYATLMGNAKIERDLTLSTSENGATTSRSAAASSSSQPVISILTAKENLVVIPQIGSLVIAKITGINPRFAKCSIISIDNVVAKENFQGQINRKDIRATEKDKIEVNKSFRSGDIVTARVISLGDTNTNSYFLSTAENDLGVIIAHSEAGGKPMLPISWNEMQCPVTLIKENRKVAKVRPEFINYLEKNYQSMQ